MSQTLRTAFTHSSYFWNAASAAIAATAMITPAMCAFHAGVVAPA
jgi:hypothetical protein